MERDGGEYRDCPNFKGPGTAKCLFPFIGHPNAQDHRDATERATQLGHLQHGAMQQEAAHHPSNEPSSSSREATFLLKEDGETVESPDDPDNRATMNDYNCWMNSGRQLNGRDVSLYEFIDQRYDMHQTTTLANEEETDVEVSWALH